MTQSPTVKSVNARLAEELAVREAQVAAAVRLLDEGATVPFIARYRKEVTGSLDDGQLRDARGAPAATCASSTTVGPRCSPPSRSRASSPTSCGRR